MPVGVSGFLPNKLYYFHIKKNDWARPKTTIGNEKNRKNLISDNFKGTSGHYLNLSIDNNGIIDAVSYLGSEPVSV